MFVFLFGFGKGKMDLTLEKTSFNAGETAKGRISLKLNKPVKARGLRVRLICNKLTKHHHRDSHGHSRTETHRTELHRQELTLGKEAEYDSGEYDFSFQIPSPLPYTIPADNSIKIGPLTLTSTQPTFEWYIESSLDIQNAFDVAKTVEIFVG
jgi:sporulation-control protein spo0M